MIDTDWLNHEHVLQCVSLGRACHTLPLWWVSGKKWYSNIFLLLLWLPGLICPIKCHLWSADTAALEGIILSFNHPDSCHSNLLIHDSIAGIKDRNLISICNLASLNDYLVECKCCLRVMHVIIMLWQDEMNLKLCKETLFCITWCEWFLSNQNITYVVMCMKWSVYYWKRSHFM